MKLYVIRFITIIGCSLLGFLLADIVKFINPYLDKLILKLKGKFNYEKRKENNK